MMRTVHVVGGFVDYINMFTKAGWQAVDTIEDADLVQFCGGEDVTPTLYNEVPLPSTRFNVERDNYEKVIYNMALAGGVPMAGICRGAQFLHVMNGGRLWQDVEGHAIVDTHLAMVETSKLKLKCGWLQVTSTHHQMIREPIEDGEVILTATSRGVKRAQNLRYTGSSSSLDVEAVYYEKTQCFCFQPHPETVGPLHMCQRLYFDALENLLGVVEKGE
jgi:gamma-glutamyl-gamma-aminobutyrate hydrolase PuuD